jgi:hypothetical protein
MDVLNDVSYKCANCQVEIPYILFHIKVEYGSRYSEQCIFSSLQFFLILVFLCSLESTKLALQIFYIHIFFIFSETCKFNFRF